MRWIVAALFLDLLTRTAALGCSCLQAAGAPATACGSFAGTEVVFVGKVIRDSGEGLGTGKARLLVEEILHGLPKDLHEVEVDTSAGTSCYMRLAKDERYVIYGGNDLHHPGVVQRYPCSFSFNLRGNERTLEALRQAQANKPAMLAGKIYTMTSQYAWEPDGPAGVSIVAEGNGVKREAKSGGDGQFEFTGLPPGDYRLSVASTDFFLDPSDYLSSHNKITIGARGCANGSLYLWPNGKIAGLISSAEGKPIEGVPVEVFAFDKKNALETQALRVQKTNAEGRYVMQGLPPGDYVVGVNAERWRDTVAYSPLVFPGSKNREEGARIHVGTGETQPGIDLALGSPRAKAVLVVEMAFEGGTPAPGGSANIEDAAGEQRFLLNDRDEQASVHRVDVYGGETYQVRAHKIAIESGVDSSARGRLRRWEGLSGLILMDAAEKHVQVVLHKVAR